MTSDFNVPQVGRISPLYHRGITDDQPLHRGTLLMVKGTEKERD
jgi:hypothetical protein